jgi:hypothetical protein
VPASIPCKENEHNRGQAASRSLLEELSIVEFAGHTQL